mmetsp:Transcript_113784/g.196726  ORF Transcript_113784/g.196726 Transcript_113784/m.196726 type:complete len:1377 (+) Transcript_113784:59-4189(+)
MRAESVQEANFQKARVRAVSGPTLLGIGPDGNGTISVGAEIGWQWRRVELIYQVREGSILSVIDGTIQFEQQIRNLPGWKMLCQEVVPQAQRRFCDPGDSFAAVVFSTQTEAKAPASAQGVLYEIDYDGNGDGAGAPLMPVEGLIEYLKTFQPGYLDSWLNINVERGDSPDSTQIMRSMFAFYLPESIANSEWPRFVVDELEPKLVEQAELGEKGEFEKEYSIHLFYRADDLKSEEFIWAVNNAMAWAGIAAIGSAIATVMVTRRVLLGAATLVMAGISSATAAASVSQFHEDGFVELPAVAIASWFLVSANSADLAIACLRAWENRDPFPRTMFAEFSRVFASWLDRWEMPSKKSRLLCWYFVQFIVKVLETAFPPREGDSATPETGWYPMGKLYWYLTGMLVPQFVSTVLFLTLAHRTELLLLQEFASHAGTGMAMATVFSVLLYPPVLDLGDVLYARAHQKKVTTWRCRCLRCGCCLRLRDRCSRCFGRCPRPRIVECGDPPHWRSYFMRRSLEVFARMLNGRPIRVVALLIVVLVTVTSIVTEFASAFVATPPPLFPVGHRSREGPKVQALFGQLPRKLDAPEPTLAGTRKCAPDAFDNATCAFFECEVESQTSAEEEHCLCFHRWGATTTVTTSTLPPTTTSVGGPTPPPTISSGRCSAVARVAGLADSSIFPQAQFWKWAEAQLDTTLGDRGNQILKPQYHGTLTMEDWATGLKFVQSQFSVGRKTANEDVPGIEDACAALMCYCDLHTCQLDSSWRELGQFRYSSEAATTTDETRRLMHTSSTPSVTEAPMRRFPTAFLSVPPVTLREPRRLTESTSNAEIYIVWGLQKSEEIPFRTSAIDLKFDHFVMKDPWTQRSILQFCEGTAPHLKIDSRQCWAMDFKRWVLGKAMRFPVNAEMFYQLYFEFTFYRHSEHSEASSFSGGGASGGRGYDYFWLAEDGTIRGTFVSFDVTAPSDQNKVKEYMKVWTEYLENRNEMSPIEDAWMASTLFAESQTADAVRDSASAVFVWSVIFASGTVLLLTFSPGLTIAVVMCLCISLLTFASFWIGVGNRDIGSLEIVSLAVFMSGLVTPLLRMAFAYSYARDRPCMPGEMMQEPDIPKGMRSMSISRQSLDWDDASREHAKHMGEGEILMFPGALANERQHRVATAIQRGGSPAMGLAMACIAAGMALLPLEMEALGQVGLSILCLGFLIPPAVLGLLPLLLLLGLGDSKARRKAFLALGQFISDRLHGRIAGGTGLLDARTAAAETASEAKAQALVKAGEPRNVSRNGPAFEMHAHKPHTVAAMMLGVPQCLVTGSFPANTPSFSRWSAGFKAKAGNSSQSAKSASDDVGTEAGPCILTLDVQGATAKPPYHIVMATRDVINMKG